MIGVGAIVLFFDGTISKPKHKRMLCVCAAEGWFLRINTRPRFKPHCPVAVSDNPRCLDHDSYIELRGVIEQDSDALLEAIASGDARILGAIGISSVKTLILAVQSAPTLNAIEKRAIVSNLERLVPATRG